MLVTYFLMEVHMNMLPRTTYQPNAANEIFAYVCMCWLFPTVWYSRAILGLVLRGPYGAREQAQVSGIAY